MKNKGIDVSRWNGNVNYSGVKSAGIDYVIIQCGFGMASNQKDPYFEINYANAKKAGMRVGVYHYSYAKTVAEAKKEARLCLSWIKGKSLDMPVYIDMEEDNLSYLGKSLLTEIAMEFCSIVEKAGYMAGVYANANWFKNYLDYSTIREKYSIWLAQYGSQRDFPCDIWQYSDNGRIKDNAGLFDMNYIYSDFVVNVTVKKNAGLYPCAYTDPVGRSSVKEYTVKKGKTLQWIMDDGFGWSKVRYKDRYFFVTNNRLNRKGLSKYPKKTLTKDIKVYVEKKGKLTKAKILKKGKKVSIICFIENGKYKGYSYFTSMGKRYYGKL